jgi:hypothetical protein
MKTTRYIHAALTIILILVSCRRDVQMDFEGTYSGTFKVMYNSGMHSGSVKIELVNSKYTCSANTNMIPAGVKGTYTVNNGKIIFNDENFWTADFDWNLILNGKYDYSFDGKNLKIYADKNSVGHYEYNLEKNKSH